MSFCSPCILSFSQLMAVAGCQLGTPSSAAATRHRRSLGSGDKKARAALKLDTNISLPSKNSSQYPGFYVNAFCIKSVSGRMEKQRPCPSLPLCHTLPVQTKLSLSVFLSSEVRVQISSPTFSPGCTLFDAGAALPSYGYSSWQNGALISAGLWEGRCLLYSKHRCLGRVSFKHDGSCWSRAWRL